jgi:uncharacterized protein YkwD
MRASLAVGLLLLGGSVAEAQAPLGLASCPSDEALSRTAAAALVGELPADANALLARAHDEGSTAPVLRAIRVALDDERRASALVERLRNEARGPVACGEARTESHLFLIAAPALGRLRVDGGTVRGELAVAFDRPLLVFRFEDGEHARVPVDRASLAHGIELPEQAEDAPTMIQLVADGPDGPRPLAELTINGTVEARASRGESVRERLEGRRHALGAPTLRENRFLAEEAHAHAEAVCRAGRVAHRLASGDPEERLAARGVRARVVGETVARGATLADAMDALERSPAHQMTLVDRRFTDVGIGAARDGDGKRCLVVLLAAWPRFLGR